ncbi:MAG: TonB-dependent receptor [Verrucomicrobiae bacterium]|nr:TonB-dependent receptor [Verrucomicrobiae bacterium]
MRTGFPRSWALAVLAFVVGLAGVLPGWAQETGSVAGTLIEGWDGRPLAGVTVTVRGTTLATVTDGQGRYQLGGVPPGEQVVRFSRPGYATAVVTEVRVLPGQTTAVNGSLRPEFYEMEEYEITAEEFEEQAVQLLQERQQSSALLDSIGSDAFARLGVSDAAGIVGKVTGASVVDGKFAVIRGLSDRYTAATLNGAEIPSADPYRKSAQLDLFPASQIERMVVAKTFTPDQPGSFTGGSVNIITRSFPERTFGKVSAGVEFNTQTSLNDAFLVAPEASASWYSLGRDLRGVPAALRDPDSLRIAGQQPRANDPARRIPGNATPEQAQRITDGARELESYQRALGPAGFAGVRDRAPLNHDYDFEFGTVLTNVFRRRLGVFAAMTYDRGFEFYEDGINNRYFADGRPRFLGREARGRMRTEVGGGANIAYELAPAHQVKFNLLFNRNIEDEARFVTGLLPEGDSQDPLVMHQLHYTERQIQAYQLAGEHEITALDGNRVDWLASYVATTQEEPDYRFFHGFLNEAGRYGFGGNTLPQPNLPSRTFRELKEENLTFRLDDTQPFTWWRGLEGRVRLGYYRSQSWRDGYERTFSYVGDRGSDANGFLGSPNDYLRDDNLGFRPVPQAGGATQLFFDRLITDAFGNNQGGGTNTVNAGYAMIDAQVWDRWRLIGGLRYETTLLDVSGRVGTNVVGNIIDEGHLLPAVGAVFAIRTNMNLRVHFAQTIARPSFREITPTRNYDVTTDDLFLGNPFLEISNVDNYDLRWEWFRRPGEVLSVSLFYKDIGRPIELEYTDQQANISIFRNRDAAKLYGVEFEARSRLDTLWPTLEDLSAGVNFAYIVSEVPLTPVELATKRQLDPSVGPTRPLYDQSPYILNLDLSWDAERWGTLVSVAANLTGERLFIANPLGVDIYEHPPVSLDLVIQQRLGERWQLKFTAKNLLDPEYRRTYGPESDGLRFTSHRRGRVFGLSLSAEF